MSVSIEREFKTMLTAAQAAAVAAVYPFAAPFIQTNTYFDTATGALRQRGMGLRIRRFETHAEQTLKVPSGPDRTLTELTDALALPAAALQTGGVVAARLADEGVAWSALRPFATATTTRRLATLPAGLLTLDHTRYPNQTSDWELELEYDHHPAATAFWQALLRRFGLTPTAPTNKVARAKANQNHCGMNETC